MKKIRKFILVSLLSRLALLTTCGQKADPDQRAGDNRICLGVSPVPHEEIIKTLEPEPKKTGLDVEVTTFDDHATPNPVLDQEDLNANSLQRAPYPDDFTKERGVKLANLGAIHSEPIGLHSDKYKSIDELEDGDEILIPNDATNGGRALILLEKAGVIKLDDPSNLVVTERDIVENPKNLKLTALDAPSISRSYREVTGAIISSNYAPGAGLDPIKDSLLTEDRNSSYANIIAVHQEKEGQEKFKELMGVLHSEACCKFIGETYKGTVVPVF